MNKIRWQVNMGIPWSIYDKFMPFSLIFMSFNWEKNFYNNYIPMEQHCLLMQSERWLITTLAWKFKLFENKIRWPINIDISWTIYDKFMPFSLIFISFNWEYFFLQKCYYWILTTFCTQHVFDVRVEQRLDEVDHSEF